MAMNYEELDEKTRGYMLEEFEIEQASVGPYISRALTEEGVLLFPEFMRNAIKAGNEISLFQQVNNSAYLRAVEQYVRRGVSRTRRVNITQAAERLALTEFSTWYVRGLAKRLIDEGVENCQIYRGEMPKFEPNECARHEGRIIPINEIYKSHRVRYWPDPGDLTAFSIPYEPNCHHVIRRA